MDAFNIAEIVVPGINIINHALMAGLPVAYEQTPYPTILNRCAKLLMPFPNVLSLNRG